MMKRVAAVLLVVTVCIGFSACGGNNNGATSAPEIKISVSTLFFGANFGLPFDSQTVQVQVTATGGGALNFTAMSDSPWLTVTPGSGAAPGSIGISALLGSLTVGTYTGHINVVGVGNPVSSATITVTFVVATAPTNTPFWAQWGANPQHTGMVSVAGQNATNILANILYEPFVAQEKREE